MERSRPFACSNRQHERRSLQSARGPPATVLQHTQAKYRSWQEDTANQSGSQQQTSQTVDREHCYTTTRAKFQELSVKGSQGSLSGHVHLDFHCQQQLHNRWIQATLDTPSAVEGAELHVQEISLSLRVAKMRRLQRALAESEVHLARCQLGLYHAERRLVRFKLHASHAKLCVAAHHNLSSFNPWSTGKSSSLLSMLYFCVLSLPCPKLCCL